MTEITFVIAILSIMLWFMTTVLVAIIALAVFRSIRRNNRISDQLLVTNIMMTKLLKIQLVLMNRYEKNLAAWYNTTTGQQWVIDEKSKKDLGLVLQHIEETVETIREERVEKTN